MRNAIAADPPWVRLQVAQRFYMRRRRRRKRRLQGTSIEKRLIILSTRCTQYTLSLVGDLSSVLQWLEFSNVNSSDQRRYIFLCVYRVTAVVHWSVNAPVRGTWSESSAGAWDVDSLECPASMSRCPTTWTGSDKSPTNTRTKDESERIIIIIVF